MKKKMFGAVALSTALALGTIAPAFAAPGAEGEGDFIDEHGNETAVYLEATTDQIQATLPVTVTMAAKIEGSATGGTMQGPSDDVYVITNKSTAGKLYVTDVAATLVDSDESDGKADWTAANATGIANVLATAAKDGSGADPVYGSVFMTLKSGPLTDAGDGKKAIAEGDLSDPVLLVGEGSGISKTLAADWEVLAATDTENGELGLRIEGGNSKLNMTTETAATEFMKVVYTVSMHPSTPTI